MPPLPFLSLLLLLLSAGSLLLTPVEAADEQGVGIQLDHQIGSERPLPLLATNALTPFPEERLSKEDRQARKLLRKKKKRLRELREEIRKMAAVSGGMKAAKLARTRDEKWRRRMLSRLDAITRRLDRLETLIVESSSRSSAKHREAEKARKMDRHFASVSRSLNGEVGMACASHRDCRPGRCCHAAASAAAAAAPAATCVQHDAAAGAGCADSCQCTLQLQCFVAKDNATQPACKRASSSDIVTGTYLNDPDAIF